jgi:hypothetical protein
MMMMMTHRRFRERIIQSSALGTSGNRRVHNKRTKTSLENLAGTRRYSPQLQSSERFGAMQLLRWHLVRCEPPISPPLGLIIFYGETRPAESSN